MQMARQADVLFVRHPKTGGTWLRALITRLYGISHGLPSNRVVRYDELARHRPGLPRLLTTSGRISWEYDLAETIATDPILREKRLLFLARNPIDVTTSWYNQFRKRTSAFKRELILADMRSPIDRETISRFDFALHPEIGLPWVIDYHNLWWRKAQQHPHALVLRYEDLLADTAKGLEQLADFLGERFTPDQIAEAVRFGSVENMRRLEREGYFRNKSLRLRDAVDPETHKVRRARPGAYREDFSPEQVERLEALVRERLAPELGYVPGA
jgi:hypothetical protein